MCLSSLCLGEPIKVFPLYSVLQRKKENNKDKIHLKEDMGDCTHDNMTSEYMNNFFMKVGPNLAKKFDKKWEYYGETSGNSIGDLNINKFHVIDVIKNIDITKSSGLDRISSNCLKDACLALCAQLTHILRMSIKVCVFPDCWKVATIVPIFKNGKTDEVSNYRPMSSLPIPGKNILKYCS